MTVLDRCWKNCKRMWLWISTNLPKRFDSMNSYQKQKVVCDLKTVWLKKNGFTRPLDHDCFFCEYDAQHNDTAGRVCAYCPARLADSTFFCADGPYAYDKHPVEFYQKIVALDKKSNM